MAPNQLSAQMATTRLAAQRQRGATLIELLAVTVVLGVLAGMSAESFKTYRQRAYRLSAQMMVHEAETALQAGASTYGEQSDGGLWIMSDATGNLMGWRWGSDGGGMLRGRDFVPGLRATPNIRVTVSHNVWCNPAEIRRWGGDPHQASCIVNVIQARHCKGETVLSRFVWNNGPVTETEWANWGC